MQYGNYQRHLVPASCNVSPSGAVNPIESAMAHPNLHRNPPANEAIVNRPHLGRIDQCVADLVSTVTQMSSQLLSIGKKQDQWMLRIDQRLEALETQAKNDARKSRVHSQFTPIGTQSPRRVIPTDTVEAARAAPASRFDTILSLDSSDDITPMLCQRKAPSLRLPPPSTRARAIKTEPLPTIQRSRFRESELTTSRSISNQNSPAASLASAGSMALQSPTTPSIPPDASTSKLVGAPLSNLIHPLSVPHDSPRSNQNNPEPNQLNGTSVRRGQHPAQSALSSEHATECPSIRVANTLSASPLTLANGHNPAANTVETNVQPSTVASGIGGPSQTPNAGLLKAHTANPAGLALSKGDRGSSDETPNPTSDGGAVLEAPIPDWLPIENSAGNKTPASSKPDVTAKDTSGGEEEEPESGNFMFMHFSAENCAPPIDDNVPGRIPTLAERAAAARACMAEHEVREDTQKSGEFLNPKESVYHPANDLSNDQPGSIAENRGRSTPISDQPTQRPIQEPSNGGITHPEIIVISDDDEAMPLRSEAIPNGHYADVKDEPRTSLEDRTQTDPAQPEIQSAEQPNPVLPDQHASFSGKRKRTSLPFTNSMSEREQRLAEMRNESQDSPSSFAESSESESEILDDGDEDGNIGGAPDALDPDYAPASVQRSQTTSAPRPLKIPRLAAPLTEVEVELRVRHADEICKTFFLDNGGNPAYAVELYTSAANCNSVVAMVRLAAILAEGAVSLHPGTTRVRKNVKSALAWVNKALRLSPHFTEALITRGDLWMGSNGKRGKAFKNAMDCYSKAAELGDVLAICRKGELWRTQMFSAKGVSRKRKCCQNAIKEFESAVEKGCARAASFLGSIFENETQDYVFSEVIRKSRGGECPESRAVELYWFSKDSGSALGTNDAAACYEVAYGPVIGNFDEARRLYEKAFRMGHLGAASNLALLYELGGKGAFEDRIDREEALRWYNIGYLMKCPVATYHLGLTYEHGSLDERDPRLAERLLVAAINYAEDSGNALDIVDKVHSDLFGIRATKVLTQSEDAEQAYKEILASCGKAKGNSSMGNVRANLAIVVAGYMNSGNRSHADMVAMANAMESAKEALGVQHYDAVVKRAKIIMQEIKARRKNNLDVSSMISPLESIVGAAGLSIVGL